MLPFFESRPLWLDCILTMPSIVIDRKALGLHAVPGDDNGEIAESCNKCAQQGGEACDFVAVEL